ncbi:MAG: hypothetical protein IJI14_00850 [Anaerolineaceae bacterium]|nr:hypothetical protein [Anaerolineaceae bacterium]
MTKKFVLILALLFSFSAASAIDFANDRNGTQMVSLISGGEFTSAHLAEGCGCPGKNPPHIYLDKMSGLCGCPSEPQIVVKGCNITVSCDLEDDAHTIVKLEIPCPTASNTDPKYPLVKMLSGTLVEWRVNNGRVQAPATLTYGSKGAEAYGSEVFAGFDLDIIVSTVDTGKKWNQNAADAIVQSTNKYSRTNIEFELEKPGFAVELMTPKDIFEAYKTKSNEVQAYLALANQGFGERPWTTYEKFVNNACKGSQKPHGCSRALLGREHLGRVGNFYLGNGNPTILGVYSEASSHTAHGATTVNDKGEPAFGIRFKSTFYVYFHASWADHGTYGNVQEVFMGYACTYVYTRTHESTEETCPSECDPGVTSCCYEETTYWETTHCGEWTEICGCEDDYIMSGGGQSSEDCPQCVKIFGYLDKKGTAHTDPFPVSFYQSQPLLINENY